MLQCIIVTPEQTLFDQPAEFVALTLFDGEIGIAPGHSPMIGRLGSGEMRIRHGGQTDRFYVQGGFVEVLGDVVSVLTQGATPASQLDRPVIEERLAGALARRVGTPETRAARSEAIEQARAQLRVAKRAEVP
jgi:F-type H+-transporting ATPase subunit epsilon